MQISLLLSFEPYAITTAPSTPVSDSESLLVREIKADQVQRMFADDRLEPVEQGMTCLRSV